MTPLLCTNNPRLSPSSIRGLDVRFLDEESTGVLATARDHIHRGWRLANHPLYGNLQPGQQPFRTLILLPPEKGSSPDSACAAPIDAASLNFIEEGIAWQASARPRSAFLPHVLKDCAFMDMELVRATIETYGGRLVM